MTMDISVVGGVYKESCAWPEHWQILGSAGRASLILMQLEKETSVSLYTSIHPEDIGDLHSQFINRHYSIKNLASDFTVQFSYDHPLAIPQTYPRDIQLSDLPKLEIKDTKAKNSIVFGMYERIPVVNCKSVVYDPQNVYFPRLFRQCGSEADELIYILNRAELGYFYKQAGHDVSASFSNQARWLLYHENAKAVVVKCGSLGALVCTRDKEEWISPCYTRKVNPIGSGDAFVAAFSHFYFVRQLSVFESAQKASIATAFYVEKGMMVSESNLNKFAQSATFLESNNPKVKKKVYLAGPFFNVSQMWLVNQCKLALESFGFEVFSPYHELGIAEAEIVAPEDIKAIDNCDLLYALFDGHDPGTLFEIGYAIKAGKQVVVYAENSTDEHLKMYSGTGCVVERDFATSIYKLAWL
ncbi:nucleoside 2-deoxyribosyltransferase [Vibrio neptunius]|nr:nucleoside 2-deoxyribosyltransferase [Vibrio neptunius]